MSKIRLASAVLVAMVLVAGAAAAQDMLTEGADNVTNTTAGPINYPFNMCWDGTYWDRQACTSTTAPSYVRVQDGSTTTLVAVAAGAAANALRVAPSTDARFLVSATTAANAAGNPIYVRQSVDGTNAVDVTHPLIVQQTDGTAVRPPPWAKFDDDAAANCVAITNASAQFTLPAAGWFYVSAIGNTAYILCGSNPTATTTVTTGFSFFVPEGAERLRYLTGAKCAVIGASTAGSLCFEHLNPAL